MSFRRDGVEKKANKVVLACLVAAVTICVYASKSPERIQGVTTVPARTWK